MPRVVVPVLVFVAVGCAMRGPTAHPAAPYADTIAAVEVPTRYDEGRWIVRPVTATGDTLDLYTDSGGGILFIARERLAPGVILTNAGRTPSGDSAFTAPWPILRSGSTFPIPRGTPQPRITTASLASFQKMSGGFPARDGFLGNRFFAGRIWVVDYPAQRLGVLTAGTIPVPLGGTTIPFTFKANAGIDDAPWFPRIRVAVDGDSLDLLFDTGATTRLTDNALTAIGDGRPASRAASFITRTVFDRWHTRHPDWRVVTRAEAGTSADMIEVPSVSVAGLVSGPVWFTARPDPNFTEYMSAWMDRPIVGALGGSGLRYFRIVADYPHARATFTRPGVGR